MTSNQSCGAASDFSGRNGMGGKNGALQRGREARDISAEIRSVAPRTDIIEGPEHVRLVVDLPGVRDEGLNISIEKNVLTLIARVTPSEVPGYELRQREFGARDFRREFTLSENFDVERVQATLRGGVLTIELPKSERQKPRKIEVRAG